MSLEIDEAGATLSLLRRAEPTPVAIAHRMEKGHDVSFSAEEFERVKVTSESSFEEVSKKGKIGREFEVAASNPTANIQFGSWILLYYRLGRSA